MTELDLIKIKEESKCMNDRILLYLKYGCVEVKISFRPWMEEIYKNLRVDGFFDNLNPKTVAAALLYYFAVVSGRDLIIRDVSTIFGIGSVAIRNVRKKLQKQYKILAIDSIHDCEYCGAYFFDYFELVAHETAIHQKHQEYIE